MISQNRADAKRQVIADQQWQTVKDEETQNQELLELSHQILDLTKAIHAETPRQPAASTQTVAPEGQPTSVSAHERFHGPLRVLDGCVPIGGRALGTRVSWICRCARVGQSECQLVRGGRRGPRPRVNRVGVSIFLRSGHVDADDSLVAVLVGDHGERGRVAFIDHGPTRGDGGGDSLSATSGAT